MRTHNHIFTTEPAFADFVQEHSLSGEARLLVQIFSGIIDENLLRETVSMIKRELPHAKIIGATTDGEIIDGEVLTQSIVISCSVFEKTEIRSAACMRGENGSFQTGVDIAKALIGKDTKLLILFADGLHTNGEELLKWVQSVNENVIVSGWLAGDNALFEHTYIFTENDFIESGVVGIALEGEGLSISTEYAFDWMTIGKKLTITSSVKNRVYTIDGMPAKDAYDRYLWKEVADQLPAVGVEFPLVVTRNGMKIARAAMQLHDDGSISFAGNMNTGDQVQFWLGNAELILESSLGIGERFEKESVESFFIYSCMARRRFMAKSITLDIAPLQAVAGTVGFFTYGEFFHINACNELLNETMTILALSENSGNPKKKVRHENNIPANSGYSTIRALSHLVNATSSELETLNHDLEMEMQEYRTLEGEKKHLEDINRIKDDFINIASHELRTPLTSINGYLSMMLDGDFGELSPVLKEAVTTVQNNSHGLISIVNDMLDTAKFDAGQMVFKDTAFSIQSNLSNIYDEYKNITMGHRLVFECSIDWSIMAYTDPIRFRQVIVNLLGNAIKFTPKDGIITLKATIEKDQKHVKIEVIDTGIGINKKDHDRIFQKFWQIDSVLSRQYKGTGLGLAISKEIVSLMGWELSFESKLWEWSDFFFLLPVQSESEETTPA